MLPTGDCSPVCLLNCGGDAQEAEEARKREEGAGKPDGTEGSRAGGTRGRLVGSAAERQVGSGS